MSPSGLLAAALGYALPGTPRAPSRPSIRCAMADTEVRKLTTLEPAAALDGLLAEPCIVFAMTTCGYCMRTRDLLEELGAEYTAVELDQIPQGGALRAELATRTGRTSVPAVFVGGEYVGGANDGGLGGALTLHRSGALTPLLAAAGSLPADAAAAPASGGDFDPVRPLFGQLLFPGGRNKKIVWGVLKADVDPSEVPDEAERARRREQAARDLVNIDEAERGRRLQASGAFRALTVALGAGLLGFHAPAVARLSIAVPLFLAYGYYASYSEGL